jgi:hypothetical protein
MIWRKRLSWVVAGVLVLGGLAILAIMFLPFDAVKYFFNLLSKDDNLSMLRPDNAIVFRALGGLVGLLVLGAGFLTAARRWDIPAKLAKRLIADCRAFFADSRPGKNEIAFLAALAGIFLMGTIVRLAAIQGPMEHDESYTVMTFADSIWHAVTDYSLPNNHVLNSILIHLSVKIWGVAPWSVRLPAFLAGILAIPCVYLLAKRLYDPWTGLTAALLTAFSPALVLYSTSARGYALVVLFTLILLILGDTVRSQNNYFAWGLIALVSALGMYTVPVMLFPFAILFTWLLLEYLLANPLPSATRLEFLRSWLFTGLAAALLTLLLYSPILIFTGLQKLLLNGFVAPLQWKDIPDTWRARFIDTWKEWTHAVPVVVVFLILAGCVLSLVLHKRLAKNRVPLQLAAVLAVMTLLVVQRYNPWARVWIYAQPLVFMWGAAGTIGLVRTVRFKALRNVPLSAVLFGLAFLAGCFSALRTVPTLPARWAAQGDLEQAVVYLKGQMQENDFVIVDWPDDAPLWFYFLEYGISNAHLDRRIPFERALVVVEPVHQQTVESVLAARDPQQDVSYLSCETLLKTIGTVEIHACSRK